MNIDTQSIQSFFKMSKIDLEFLKRTNTPLTIFPELIGILHFMISEDETLSIFKKRYSSICENGEDVILEKAGRIFIKKYYDVVRNNEREFIKDISRIYVESYENQYLSEGFSYNYDFSGPNEINMILDLASGPDFINFIPIIPKSNNYTVIDPSPFVTECILYKSMSQSVDCITIPECTAKEYLEKYSTQDFDVIRAKNIFRYDQQFDSISIEYLRRLQPNGLLIFQETTSEKSFSLLFKIEQFNGMCINLINNGSCVRFIEGDARNPLSLDSLIFEKKKGNISDFNLIKERFA